MKTKLLICATALFVAGCASSPKTDYSEVHPEILSYCENVSALYGQVHELKSMKYSRVESAAFLLRVIDEEPMRKEAKDDIKTHTRQAIHSVYDNPKTSQKEWVSGIKEQCVNKPGII